MCGDCVNVGEFQEWPACHSHPLLAQPPHLPTSLRGSAAFILFSFHSHKPITIRPHKCTRVASSLTNEGPFHTFQRLPHLPHPAHTSSPEQHLRHGGETHFRAMHERGLACCVAPVHLSPCICQQTHHLPVCSRQSRHSRRSSMHILPQKVIKKEMRPEACIEQPSPRPAPIALVNVIQTPLPQSI